MVKKIVISYYNNIAAILNNNRIEEIVLINHTYQVNDVYLGIVQKIFSSINAAFIKLGKYGKCGFIHLSDIKPLKRGKYVHNINDVLTVNQVILVQIVKEPSFNKGPRLTANIHLHGKYLILMPFSNTVSISNKVYDNNERMYLYSLALLIKPRNMGILIKLSAQGITEKAILKDLDLLKKQWYFIEKNIILTSYPCLIYKDEDLIKKLIRDFYDQTIKKIIIDSEDGLQLLYYHLYTLHEIPPTADTKLQFYNKSECILEQFKIKKVIKDALKPKVKLLSGAYLVIESYEALTIIDVNSGSFNKSHNSKETILRTNFYAAIEIAHQLKIRNINGVVIVDFIDMHSQRDQLQLLEHFNRLLKFDNSRPQIVQLSELGFVELTRRRTGQSLQEVFFNVNNFKCYGALTPEYYYFHNILSSKRDKTFLMNKHIRSLFFKKKFFNNTLLKNKKIYLKSNLYNKYFMCLDKINTVYFFNLKANCIVPVIFYVYLIYY